MIKRTIELTEMEKDITKKCGILFYNQAKELTMHYDIDYSNISPQIKHDKALQDIKDYMGEDKYETLILEFREMNPISLESFRMYMSFAGVQGYPVQAFYNEVWPYG